LRARGGREQQFLDDVAFGRVGIDPVARHAVEVDEQVDLLMCDFGKTLALARDRNEIDVAFLQERMGLFVDSGGNDSHFEQRPLRPTEDEAHADDQADGQ
jgi:hypothetical protein